MKTTNQSQHTQGELNIIKTHPVLDSPAIVINSGFNKEKGIERVKVICVLPDWRGDAFTALDEGEAEANAKRIVKAWNMHDELVNKLELLLGAYTSETTLSSQNLSIITELIKKCKNV